MSYWYENDGVNPTTSYDWTGALDTAGKLFGAVQSGVGAASPFAALALADATASRQQAAAYYQQGLYEVQASDTLRLAQIRADQDEKYAGIQAGRKLQQAEMQATNYTIAGNTLLRNMERANATVRARAAANGIAYNEGSAASVQVDNVTNTYRDVGITNLNALTARIMGYEDASAMVLAAKEQKELSMNAAETQAKQLRMAGDFAVKSGGILSGATMTNATLDFAKTVKNPFA
jgi:hypothetical protein